MKLNTGDIVLVRKFYDFLTWNKRQIASIFFSRKRCPIRQIEQSRGTQQTVLVNICSEGLLPFKIFRLKCAGKIGRGEEGTQRVGEIKWHDFT